MFILEFFENLRNPFLNAIFSVITRFGEEVILILLAIIVMWCVSKRWGFFMLYTGLLGQIINQSLKIFFEVPRPWVAYPDFSPLPSAIKEATGYSFPSGHTQCATSLFGAIAAVNRRKPIVFWLCTAIVFFTGVSRCYLGVHYPLDVIVSWVIGIILIIAFFKVFENYGNTKTPIFDLLRIIAFIISAAFCIYTFVSVGFTSALNDFDIDSMTNASKLFGAAAAFIVCWKIDEKYINYDVKAPALGQIFKVAIGMVIIFAIKTYLKTPLTVALGNQYLADGIRYFLLVVFAGSVWPLTFKFWSSVGKNNKNKV